MGSTKMGFTKISYHIIAKNSFIFVDREIKLIKNQSLAKHSISIIV